MAWATSNRRSELPPTQAWEAIRKRVIRRDAGRCVACGAPGTDVDHIIPGADHNLGNLQLLCRDCHQTKTQRESAQARNFKRVPTRKMGRPGTRSEPTPDPW